MQFTAKQIGEFLNGTVEGDENAQVSTLSKIEDGTTGALCFLSNPKYENFLYTTSASVVIVAKDFVPTQPTKATLVKVQDPYSAFSVLLDKYNEVANMNSEEVGVHSSSFVHPTANIGKNVYIGAFCCIEQNVVIGDNAKIYAQTYIGADSKIGAQCTLFPGVKLYKHTIVGDRVTVHSNTVIGSDGFGFAPQKDGSYPE